MRSFVPTLLALALVACGGAPAAPDPDPDPETTSTTDPDVPVGTSGPIGTSDTPGTIGGPVTPRPATEVRFEVTAFAAGEGGALPPAARAIPRGVGDNAQFWPGDAGEVIERQVGEISQWLAGDALSHAWRIGDLGAVAKVEQVVMKVVGITRKAGEPVADGGRFARAPVSAEKLPADGRWFRVRFFPGGVWKQAQVQGYARIDENAKGITWYRVSDLPRGLFGPQSRDYAVGDLFELRRVDRPKGVALHPFESK